MRSKVSVERIIDLIATCTKEKNQVNALRVYMYLRKHGLDTHNLLGNYVVPMLADTGFLQDAQVVFHRLACQNEYSMSSFICSCIKCGEAENAFKVYYQMRERGVHPSAPAYVSLLQGCTILKDAVNGRAIHANINNIGLAETDLHIGSTLVDMYAKCSLLDEAQEAFHRCHRRNVVLWNALIAGYADQEQGSKALLCFEQMQKEGIYPSPITLTCVLKACGCAGAKEKGHEVHDQVEKRGLIERDVLLGNAAIDMYAKFGLFAEAKKLFSKLQGTDVVSWTALIAGHLQHEHVEDALICLDQMQHFGIPPNAITYACCLKACASLEDLEKGQYLQNEVVLKGFDLFLRNALIDLYLECGLLPEARQEFDKLEVHDSALWNGLVSGHKFKVLPADGL